MFRRAWRSKWQLNVCVWVGVRVVGQVNSRARLLLPHVPAVHGETQTCGMTDHLLHSRAFIQVVVVVHVGKHPSFSLLWELVT